MSNPVTASITIQDFGKSTLLLQDSVTLNLENGFQALKTIQVTRRLSLILMVLYDVNKATATVWCEMVFISMAISDTAFEYDTEFGVELRIQCAASCVQIQSDVVLKHRTLRRDVPSSYLKTLLCV